LTRKERRLAVQLSPGAENSPELTELVALMNLVPGRTTYDIALAARGSPDPEKFPSPPGEEIRIVPRSIAQATFFLSSGLEVPAEHVCWGLVRPMLRPDGSLFDSTEITRGLFAVHVCKGHKPPPNAYVAIHYRGYWYYIDDRDAETKATFGLLFYLIRL